MGTCVSKSNFDLDDNKLKSKKDIRSRAVGPVQNKSIVSPLYEDNFNPANYFGQKHELKNAPVELIALFNYKARTHDEISLSKSDPLVALNQNDDEWWFVENLRTTLKGYVPSSYVSIKGTLEAEEWFIPKLSRKESERLLLKKGYSRGTFLVRASETTQGTLTLSIRDQERGRGPDPNSFHDLVKHFRIRINSDSRYYITTKTHFDNLQSLIKYYSESANGLCCRLTGPCQKPTPLTLDLSIQTKDKWEISQKSIRLLEKLGAGQFGEVWKAIWNNTTEVAVKTLKPGSMSKEEFLKEARIMKSIQHPKLVRLYAVCLEDPIYIITELMLSGSLLDYLREGLGRSIEFEVLIDFMEQIACGMSYLELNHFIHRDLAARNILVGENNTVKIADFGLARMVEDRYDVYTAAKGTKFPIKWTAPEAALTGRFTVKSDVWSYGIVLYEIVTRGQIPYPAFNNTETLTKVSTGYRMQRPALCPEPIYRVMLETWHQDAEKRPTFNSLSLYFEEYPNNPNNSLIEGSSRRKENSFILDEPSPRMPARNQISDQSRQYPLAVV